MEVDVEASVRSNSFYFPHKVFPMLPEILCEHLCSLNAGQDRLAFSVFFTMDSEGNLYKDEENKL
jgi:ribonuclease R